MPIYFGFPSDDGLALQQMASDDVNLDIYWDNEFVQNETAVPTWSEDGRQMAWRLEQKSGPVNAGTTTGTIYYQGRAAYTFVVTSAWIVITHRIDGPCPTCAEFEAVKTGNLRLKFAEPVNPDDISVVCNYESNLEVQLPHVRTEADYGHRQHGYDFFGTIGQTLAERYGPLHQFVSRLAKCYDTTRVRCNKYIASIFLSSHSNPELLFIWGDVRLPIKEDNALGQEIVLDGPSPAHVKIFSADWM